MGRGGRLPQNQREKERIRMERKRLTAFAMAVMLGVMAVQPVYGADWQSKNPLIAHAFGEADGKIETNSKEAFITSWENGYRVVEGDFTYTSDGTLVLRHDFDADGSYYRLEIEPKGALVMDAKTFTETPIIYEQTPITAVDLLYLMQEYPDMYVVTDTKKTDKATVQKQFGDLKAIATNIGAPEVLERIIPQIYNQDMLGWVKEIHPFQNWIFTLYLLPNPNYAEIAAFCAANGIDTVTLKYDRVTQENLRPFKEKGIKVYAHTVNRYLQFKELLAAGADGIYTDRIKPYELEWVGLENGRKLTEQTVQAGGTELTLPTLEIFGKTHVPLRRLAEVGKKFSASYDQATDTLELTTGKSFTGLGNELLLDDSGKLVTKKATFRLLLDGKETGIQCFWVDGEIYAPLEELSALLQN